MGHLNGALTSEEEPRLGRLNGGHGSILIFNCSVLKSQSEILRSSCKRDTEMHCLLHCLKVDFDAQEEEEEEEEEDLPMCSRDPVIHTASITKTIG